MSSVIETKLVLSGQDAGATRTIEALSKALKEAGEGAKVSAQFDKLAKSLLDTEKAQKAVSVAMKAQAGLKDVNAGLRAASEAAKALGTEYDRARKAAEAFKGVKAAKGSDQARAATEAAMAVREAGKAYRQAEGEVRKATAAVSAQMSALQGANRAASALGAPINRLAEHQRTLANATRDTTVALLRQEAAEKRTAAAADRRSGRRQVMAGAAGAVGLKGVHEAQSFTRKSLHTYQEFDNERRFGRVVMGLTDQEQRPLVDQAIRMGATTRYNDVQVLEAQRELAARGLKKDQVMGLMEPAANLGQSMDLRLPDAVKQMEGAIFGFKKDISTLDAAKRSAAQTADVQVKAAKISGMTPEDISQAYKYGATPARMAGVSEATLLAFAGLSKKANMGGDESGVAFRALIAATNSPTRKGKEVMLANGMDFKNYQKNPDSLALDPFVRNIAAQYGVKLDKNARSGLGKIFKNKDLISDPAKFAPAVSGLLSDVLGGDDAKSKKSIAGAANRYRDASVKGIDQNAFIADLMKKIPGNLQLANSIFGSKQGSRIATALGDPETLKHMIDEIMNHSEGFSSKVSAARMEGFDGAVKRFEGAVTNLETKLGRSFDAGGDGGFLTKATDATGKFIQHLAELDDKFIQTGAAVAAVGTAFVGAKSIGLLASGFGLSPAAAALTASATALDAAAAKLAGGKLTDGPDKKGGKKGALAKAGGVAANIGGGLLLPYLAEAAQSYGALAVPDPEDGIGKGILKFLDPGLADRVYGKPGAGQAVPSMTKPPGAAPMTIGGAGLSSFGLGGPAEAVRAQERVAETTKQVGEESSTTTIILNGLKSIITTLGQSAEGATLQLQSLSGGVTGGGGGGGGLIRKASFSSSDLGGAAPMGRGGGVGGGGSRRGGAPGGGGVRGNEDPDVVAYIRESAVRNGIDPGTAVAVARTEGLGGSSKTRNTPGDYAGGRPTSFGPFQLHYGSGGRGMSQKGLGNAYTRETGNHASDATHWKEQIDFALRTARKSGWGQWYGARNNGIGNMQGIGRPVPKGAPGETEERARTMQKTLPPKAPSETDATLQRVAASLAEMNINSHHTVEVSATPGSKARTVGMRSSASGPIKADTGVSMPQAQARDGDWI